MHKILICTQKGREPKKWNTGKEAQKPNRESKRPPSGAQTHCSDKAQLWRMLYMFVCVTIFKLRAKPGDP